MGERTRNEMGNLSLQAKNKFPRDLLQRFMVGSGDPGRSDPEEDPDPDLELNLGLSMGGRFGVDKSSNKLVRASSIATILPVVRDDDVLGGKTDPDPGPGPGRSYSNLVRTSSLPVETEDEWRKRKELQSLRRLAAKRRRSEKQRSLTRGEREEYVAAMGRVGSSVAPLHGSSNWVPGGKQAGFSGGIPSGGGGRGGYGQPSSQGSLESQAGSCSSMSEFEGRHLQGSGSGSGGEASPVSMQPIQERTSQDATGPSAPETPAARTNETGLGSGSTDMPCVFTQGDGPNGRRIEGILYKYGKGEEVKIMCVCHGSFLSPAEFVVHAGGTDVDHPLRHIVVNPNSSASSYL